MVVDTVNPDLPRVRFKMFRGAKPYCVVTAGAVIAVTPFELVKGETMSSWRM